MAALERPCNALEARFVRSNSRLVCAIRFPPVAAEIAAKALLLGLRSTVSGWLSVEEGEPPRLRVLAPGEAPPAPERCAVPPGGLESACAAEAERPHLAYGPYRTSLLLSGDGQCVGLTINGCRALGDVQSLAGPIQLLALQISGVLGNVEAPAFPRPTRPPADAMAELPVPVVPPAPPSPTLRAFPPQRLRGGAAGGGGHVRLELRAAPEGPAAPGAQSGAPPGTAQEAAGAAPHYLPLPGPPISLRDIACLRPGAGGGGSNNTPPADGRAVLHGDAVRAAQRALRGRGATITGLWVACLQQALAELYLADRPAASSCCVSVSVLADLRGSAFKARTDPRDVPQAFGSVALGATTGAVEEADRGAHVLMLAAVASEQLRSRMARGEAHRSARALAGGKAFAPDFTGPAATIELGNQVVFSIPESFEVALAQRRFADEGVSVAVHSEQSGKLVITASSGAGVDAAGLDVVTAKAAGLFLDAASLDSSVTTGAKTHRGARKLMCCAYGSAAVCKV